jgi:hypothetical protein
MPEGCILFSQEILHRDFFRCNPSNTGHHEYPKFEKMSYDSGCTPRTVNNFLAKAKADNDAYAIFRTRHASLKSKSSSTVKVVGYFKFGKQDIFKYPKLKGEKRGFWADEVILLPKDECIEIDYSYRSPLVSWTKVLGNHHNHINNVLKSLKTLKTSDKNIKDKYQKETREIMNLLKKRSGREEIMRICDNCKVKLDCYWGKKSKDFRSELENLYSNQSSC